MKFKFLFYLFLFPVISYNLIAQESKRNFNIHTVAFYNLENLFDTINDVNKNVISQGVKLSARTREVAIDSKLISLTYTEFQILHLLISHPGWVFTRYQIIDKIRGDSYPVTDRSIDFQIVGLRKKMMGKGNLIETIRGVGYRFQHHET